MDTVQEDDLKCDWPFAERGALLGALSRYGVMGLDKSTKLTPDEWKAFVDLKAQGSFNATAEKEFEELFTSLGNMEARKQFDTCALEIGPSALSWQIILVIGR